MTIFERIKLLSNERGLNIKDVAIKLGYGENYFYSLNSGKKPSSDKLEAIADFFDVSTDYILGRTDKKRYYDLTEKDEQDIQKELKKIIDGDDVDSAFAAFDGRILDELDEEDRHLLINSWENTLKLTKRMAKQKFTPKKYRD